jgi:hypothetical protein
MRGLGFAVGTLLAALSGGCIHLANPDREEDAEAIAARIIGEHGYDRIELNAEFLRQRLMELRPEGHVSWSPAESIGDGLCAAYRVRLLVVPHQTPPEPARLMPYVIDTQVDRLFYAPSPVLESSEEGGVEANPDCGAVDPGNGGFFEASSPEAAKLGAVLHQRIRRHIEATDDRITVTCQPVDCGDTLKTFANTPPFRIEDCSNGSKSCVYFVDRELPRGFLRGVKIQVLPDDRLDVEIDHQDMIVVTEAVTTPARSTSAP